MRDDAIGIAELFESVGSPSSGATTVAADEMLDRVFQWAALSHRVWRCRLLVPSDQTWRCAGSLCFVP